MCVEVLIQRLTVVERLAARLVFAGEKPLVCVSAVMPIQGPTVTKRVAARLMVASKRTLIRMPAVVGLEC